MKIAIFANGESHILSDLKFHPNDKFVRILNETDLDGREFDGVITVWGFWRNKSIEKAYNILESKQPELFNKTENHGL